MNFTWTDGRSLETITKGEDTISYKYNKDGIRTEKTINGVTIFTYCENNVINRIDYNGFFSSSYKTYKGRNALKTIASIIGKIVGCWCAFGKLTIAFMGCASTGIGAIIGIFYRNVLVGNICINKYGISCCCNTILYKIQKI